MRAKGRTIVVAIFGVGVVMSLGGWWFRYQASRRSAAFWGPFGAPLIVGDSKVELLVLGAGDVGAGSDQRVAGHPVTTQFDLSDQRGLIHLRYALTQDANFSWDELQRTPSGGGPPWRYALRCTDGDQRLDLVFTDDFGQLGKIDAEDGHIDVLPCPRLAPVLERLPERHRRTARQTRVSRGLRRAPLAPSSVALEATRGEFYTLPPKWVASLLVMAPA